MIWRRSMLRILMALSIGLSIAGARPLSAQTSTPPVDDSPRFEIKRFVFEGASLIPVGRFEEETRQFTGKERSFADVQRALEVIERAYADSGFSAVQVVLPEQELERGEIRFEIIEAKIGRVIVEGNKFFDTPNIRASVPALVPGQAPNIHAIARNLRIANESPAKQTTVLLRSGQEEATVDAVLRVVDEKPLRVSITVDNTGTHQTGRLRTGIGLQNADVWGKDHVFTFQYVTAPYMDAEGEPDRFSILPSRKVFIVGAGYRIPIYSRGDMLEFSAGYSNVNSGTVANLFSISGVGGILGVRYTQHLEKRGDYEHRLVYSLDHRGYQNKGVRAAGTTTQLIPDVAVHPISVSYGGLLRRQESETSFSFGFSQNFPGGNDGRGDAFCAARNNGLGFCANGRYMLWRWSVNHSRALGGDWQMRLGMNGQMTRDMLISGEQFGVGGADSVRGFLEREITNDNGHRGTVEFYTPDWGKTLPLAGARARALVFVDWAGTKRNRPAPGEAHGQHIASLGAGIRVSRGNNLSFRVDGASVFDQGGLQGKEDKRLHFSFSYIF